MPYYLGGLYPEFLFSRQWLLINIIFLLTKHVCLSQRIEVISFLNDFEKEFFSVTKNAVLKYYKNIKVLFGVVKK